MEKISDFVLNSNITRLVLNEEAIMEYLGRTVRLKNIQGKIIHSNDFLPGSKQQISFYSFIAETLEKRITEEGIIPYDGLLKGSILPYIEKNSEQYKRINFKVSPILNFIYNLENVNECQKGFLQSNIHDENAHGIILSTKKFDVNIIPNYFRVIIPTDPNQSTQRTKIVTLKLAETIKKSEKNEEEYFPLF